MANIKGTKSEENLLAAFAGESKARNKYTYYAITAQAEGYDEVAELFEKMANNEKEHAKIWFKMLYDGLGTTQENIMEAANGENGEWQSMYPSFAAQAREDGLEMLANMFERVAAIEKDHERVFLQELVKFQAMQNKTPPPVYHKPENMQPQYRCMFCGHLETLGTEAPVVCPVCGSIGAFEIVSY